MKFSTDSGDHKPRPLMRTNSRSIVFDDYGNPVDSKPTTVPQDDALSDDTPLDMDSFSPEKEEIYSLLELSGISIEPEEIDALFTNVFNNCLSNKMLETASREQKNYHYGKVLALRRLVGIDFINGEKKAIDSLDIEKNHAIRILKEEALLETIVALRHTKSTSDIAKSTPDYIETPTSSGVSFPSRKSVTNTATPSPTMFFPNKGSSSAELESNTSLSSGEEIKPLTTRRHTIAPQKKVAASAKAFLPISTQQTEDSHREKIRLLDEELGIGDSQDSQRSKEIRMSWAAKASSIQTYPRTL